MVTRVNRDALCLGVLTQKNKVNLLNEAPQYIKVSPNREYPCLLLNGTLTVEAAFCGTIFFLAFFSLLYLFPMMTKYNHIEMRLAGAVQEYAARGTKAGRIEGFVKEGISIRWKEEEEICSVEQRIEIPFVAAIVPDVKVYQQMRTSTYEGKSMTGDKNKSEEYVYITEHGSVYHKDYQCVYLKPSVQPIRFYHIRNERNSSGGKYYCCEKCSKNQTPLSQDTVYITTYGTKWHLKRECKGIKHDARKVKLFEVGMLSGCSKCCK